MAFEKRKSTPSYCLKDIYSPLIKDTDLLASASGKSLNTISRKKGVLTGYASRIFTLIIEIIWAPLGCLFAYTKHRLLKI